MPINGIERNRADRAAAAARAALERDAANESAAAGRKEIDRIIRSQAGAGGEKQARLWQRVFERKGESPDEERTAALTEALDRRDATGSFGNRAPATTLDGGQRGTPAPPDANTAVNDWIRGRGEDDL